MATAKVPTPVKKCDCDKTKWRHCKHNWVARYYDPANHQREQSFPWNAKGEAEAFLLTITQDKRAGTYVDPSFGRRKFSDVLSEWVEKRKAESSKASYRSSAKLHINPVLGNMTLSAVASQSGRVIVEELLTKTMPGKDMGASQIRRAHQIISGVLNDAYRRGLIQRPQLHGIELPAVTTRADIIFVSYKELDALAGALPKEYRLVIWLMRECGLRLGEALGVSKNNLRDGNTILRCTEQLMAKGRVYGPLKHRKETEYRDVPVIKSVAEMILAQPAVDDEGHLFTPIVHQTFQKWFSKARRVAGIVARFTSHQLRHIFASVCLEKLIPITDVSKWLGHKDINVTFAIYGHLTPNSYKRALSVLESEYESWKTGTPAAPKLTAA